MDPKLHQLPNYLLELNDIEELFISRIHVVMKVYRLEKENAGYKGNMLNVEQDLQTALNKLPLLPSELPVFVVRKSNPSCSNRYKDFRIRRDNILKWLIFFKSNNPHYYDIFIDYKALQNLPSDG